jgi:MATE family multidrug resistance protein
VRTTLAWAVGFAVLIAAAFGLGGARFAASFSTDPAVIAAAGVYAPWAAALPLAGVASFVFDGVFIGAGWTRAMLVTMMVALAVFVAAILALNPPTVASLGNNGLWLAFTLFLLARTAGQALCLPGLARRAFAAGDLGEGAAQGAV